MKNNRYLVAFLFSFVLLSPFVIKRELEDYLKNHPVETENEMSSLNSSEQEETKEDTASGETEKSNAIPEIPETETQDNMETVTEVPEEDSESEERQIPDITYFDDVLFIGDSRTMGLCEYGDVGNADIFASTGMSVYEAFSAKSAVAGKDGTKKTLEEMLADKRYGKIYLMLGINELGYDFNKTIEKYREMVRAIRERQPEAELILELNQHVTVVQSQKKPLFGNENINRMNDAIRDIGREEGLRVLDVNELFDDETGALNPELTFDNVHVLGKYYKEWTDWILQKESGQ